MRFSILGPEKLKVVITVARHNGVQLFLSKKQLTYYLLTHQLLPKVGGYWEHTWGVQDTFVTLRPWLDFLPGVRLHLHLDHKRRTLAIRSPLSRDQDRALRRAASEATGCWSVVTIQGHIPPPWMEVMFDQLTDQVHDSILRLGREDPRITAALT